MQGPEIIRSQSRNPKTFFIDYDATFDFLVHVPEGNHAGTMFFSNSGHSDAWKFHGYGCHTFTWANAQGERKYIKYTFLKKGGQRFLGFETAQKLYGVERSVDVPFAVADPIVSRQSHHKNEGTDVEYKQARELYNRVMDDTQRDHLHNNTATCMNPGVSQRVRTLYLGQVHNISPDYVKGVISYLTDKNVDLAEVEKLSKDAAMMGKSQKYKPKESALHFLTGRDVPINTAPYPEKQMAFILRPSPYI